MLAERRSARSDVQAFRKRLGLRDEWALVIGVDRIDYTKGIPERLSAVERLLERYPEWREPVRVAADRRAEPDEITERYQELNDEVDACVDARSTRSTAPTTGSRSSCRARTTARRRSSRVLPRRRTCASCRRCTTA